MKIFSIKAFSAVFLGLTLALGGCASKKTSQSTGFSSGGGSLEWEPNGDSDTGKAGGIQTVYFSFNSSQLSGDARSVLDENAKFLQDNSSISVEIEGHCDERGGEEYNRALGERRAKAVKRHFLSMGISSSRLSTISYGKDRPLDFGHDEMSWSQNRRANFRILAE